MLGQYNVPELFFAQMEVRAESGPTLQVSGQEGMSAGLRQYLDSQGVSGSVAVMKGRETLFNEGFGFAERGRAVRNAEYTTYPIGSITKTIVATAVMQLQEQGKLSVDDYVARFLPEFPNGKKIKLYNLLNHTSGIQPPRLRLSHPSPEMLVRGIMRRGVLFPAGSRWDYNDANYIVLGYIVQQVAGVPLHEYIQDHVFERAGMVHSGFLSDKPAPNASVGYLKKMHGMLASRPLDAAALFGFGDIYTTAGDLCLFDQALMGGRLIKKESLAQMLKPGSASGYGLGLYNAGYAVYSRGVLKGWEALHVYYKDGTTVAILLNVRDKKRDIHELAKQIFKMTATSTPSPLNDSKEGTAVS